MRSRSSLPGVLLRTALRLLLPVALAATGARAQERTAPASASADGDLDGDGVPDRLDACPRTPRGLRVALRGCAAVELLAAAPRFAGPFLAAVERAEANLGADRALVEAVMALQGSADLARSAAALLAEGDACGAARVATDLDEALRKASSVVQGAVDGLAENPLPLQESRAGDRGDHGDPTPGELRLTELASAGRFVEEAQLASRGATAPMRLACAALGQSASALGLVRSIDEAARTVTLAGGAVIFLPRSARTGGLHVGSRIEAAGPAFQDGAVIAQGLSIPQLPVGQPLELEKRCLEPRVAPRQRFNFSLDPVVLHDPRGYLDGGDWKLERGARIGAAKGPCTTPKAPDDGSWYEYGMVLTGSWDGGLPPGADPETYESAKSAVLAHQLDPQGTAALPAEIGAYGLWLSWTVERLQYRIDPATGAKELVGTTEVGESGQSVDYRRETAFCPEVHYANEDLNVDPMKPLSFATTQVVSFQAVAPGADAPPAFSARGYRVTNGVSSRPYEQDVFAGTEFAVYGDDLFSLDNWFDPVEATGVDKPAGLIWPRVKGTRGGKPFWYTCELPTVSRDVVETCADAPNTYYRAPFTASTSVPWTIWQGVDGSFSHQGAFAWDMGGAAGDAIRAARRGVVWAKDDAHTDSCFALSGGDKQKAGELSAAGKCPVNFVLIRHSDGSFGRYFHMEQGSVAVAVGDQVLSGQLLATVGNVGYSTGPHLHFDTTPMQGAPTAPARFQFKGRSCYVPQQGDVLYSTNTAP